MREIFKLIKQLPKPDKITVNGYLSVDKKTKQATFWTSEEKTIAAILEKVEIRFANSEGMLLYGFEPYFGSGEKQLFRYQEWWLAFLDLKCAKEII